MQERPGAALGPHPQESHASDGGGQLTASEPRVSLTDYRALAAFRYELRCFLAFSEQAARAAGIEPQQHQLLLAVRGLPDGLRPNIRTISERLLVQHHTAVALVDKLEQRGLVRRERQLEDKREVLIRLTAQGSKLLRELSRQHRARLKNVGPEMVTALSAILGTWHAAEIA
ncbi:MAG TPA: MarR family transcriptional regulator [Polyangiaceae bacterium]